MTMKPDTELNTMMFFDDALESERTYLLTELADAVSETRTAADQAGFLSAGTLSGTDGMVVTLAGNGERLLLTAVYDNLGQGASGAALECLNLIMGKVKAYGLVI